MIKVIGLQRSGTNYLTELIKLNFNVEVGGFLDPFWKHSFPTETEIVLNSGRIHKQSMPMSFNGQIILVYKPFDVWFESIKRNEADLKVKRPYIYTNGSLDKEKSKKLWGNYHVAWQDLNIFIINYITLLEDYRNTIVEMKTRLNLKPKYQYYEEIKNIKKVPHSKEFTEEKRKYYLDIN